MQISSKKIAGLLQANQPLEVRCAAALVLGAVGARDADVGQALAEALQDSEPSLRLQAIRAAGKLRLEPTLAPLLARIKDGGSEAEEAAQAAARFGAKGMKALQELMPKVAPGLRRYIGAALAGAGGSGAEAATILLDSDPGVIQAAVRSLSEQIPLLGPEQRRALTDQLLPLLGNKKNPLPVASEAAVVRLLAALDDSRAATALWDCILPPHPSEVRTEALQGLGKWVAAPGKEQLKRLFACAGERDFRVAAPALVILQSLPVNERSLPEWLSLLQAPDVAVRHLAMQKVGDRDTEAVASALLQQLGHPDRALREGALERLTKLKQGRAVLTKALLGESSSDRAWMLARAQAPFARDYPADWREEVFSSFCRYLEAGDRRSDPLLFLLREADAAETRNRLEERALYWRKKKEYATALLYLRLLARDPACGFPIRFEQAACGLRVSAHELAPEARAADPCLAQLSNLCQNYEAELTKEIEKARWLEPEDLYYLGFHLAEQEGRQKQVAGEVLHLLVKRSPRTKLAQAAKSKLRSAGLE